MDFSTFEIKICGQKLCAQKDGFRKSGHIWLCMEAGFSQYYIFEILILIVWSNRFYILGRKTDAEMHFTTFL